MLFSSYAFLLFVGILLICYYGLFRGHQQLVLLVFSWYFFAASNPLSIPYLLFTIVVIYLAARAIEKSHNKTAEILQQGKGELSREQKKEIKAAGKKTRLRYQTLGIALALAVLVIVKYSGFFIGNLNAIFSAAGSAMQFAVPNLLMPLGISFYTLQAIGYLIDVGRGTIPAEKNFLKFMLFVSYFPQLIQGPISRFADLSETLFAQHRFNREEFFYGLERVLWGFFKKIVIADRLAPAVALVTGDAGTYRGGFVLAGMFLYTLQLYADFTGGIDIVIGLSQMLGIRVMENFDLPYFSTSLKDYWRRWHISMRNWFRDYVFYPVSVSRPLLGFAKFTKKHLGERAGKRIPVYLASLIVWALTGLWHGASWNFLVWGLLNFAILMFSEEMEPVYEKFHARTHLDGRVGWTVFQIIRTLLLISVLNIFDCYKTLGETLTALGSIFSPAAWAGMGKGALATLGLTAADCGVVAVGVVILLAVGLYKRNRGPVRPAVRAKAPAFRYAVWALLFVGILVFGAYGIGYDASQFIYNQF